MKNTRFASVFTVLIFCSCGNDKPNAIKNVEIRKDTITSELVPELKSKKRKKLVAKEVSSEELKPISDNFNRINAIPKWTSTVKKDFFESTEGGEADYCYLDGKLEKIIYREYGETYQTITEFYLLDGKLSFGFEKNSKYNRPIYWDSTAMKENGDNQVWDENKSEITETRNFFKEGKLIHQLLNEEKRSLTSTYLLDEEKRLQRQYEKLLPAPVQDGKLEK